MQNENGFQQLVISKLGNRFPGCLILKNDPNYIQGIPDLIMLWHEHWAALETKRAAGAKHRPNQDYYINMLNKMSYASFVCPENLEEVLNEIQRSFEPRGVT